MFLLIFNSGSKDWIPQNPDAESERDTNILRNHRTACQVAEDLRRIRDNYYLERRNVF